ncbi:unnamed protein product, partial [Rotaria socialis]
DVINEVDSSINRYNTQKGKIMAIDNNKNHCTCQRCDGTNIIDEVGVIRCIHCHALLLKVVNIIDFK